VTNGTASASNLTPTRYWMPAFRGHDSEEIVLPKARIAIRQAENNRLPSTI
jgi:hypothetical protein